MKKSINGKGTCLACNGKARCMTHDEPILTGWREEDLTRINHEKCDECGRNRWQGPGNCGMCGGKGWILFPEKHLEENPSMRYKR
jgi:hypothetical protein